MSATEVRPTETPTTPAKVYVLAITLGTISGAICWVLTGWLGL